jgi:hypothetical protein
LNEQVLEKTKTGNAPEEENINSELHKYMPKELKLKLCCIFQLIAIKLYVIVMQRVWQLLYLRIIVKYL